MKTTYNTRQLAIVAAGQGLNAHTLAKKSGVSYGTVWKIFRGEQVTGTTLLKIVAVIPDLSIADITIPIEEPAEVLKR